MQRDGETMSVFIYGKKALKLIEDDIARRQAYDEQCQLDQRARMQWAGLWNQKISEQNEKCLELLTQILDELKRRPL
jgi:hypothetical protein